MHRESERAIQERIEATRDRMGHTIEQIGDRVNPDRVQRELKNRARDQVDELKTNVKRKARSTMRDVEHGVSERGRGLWAAIKENPIPAGMIGVGAAWLMANGSGRSHQGSYPADRAYRGHPEGLSDYGAAPAGYPSGYAAADEDLRMRTERDTPGAYSSGYTGAIGASGPIGDMDESSGKVDEAKERASEAADNVREKGEHAMHSAREKSENAMHSAREKGENAMHSAREKGSELKHRAEEGMHQARERASHWSDEAQYRARRAEHRIEDSVRDNPMTAGAVAAALGFAAGMMIPETRKEHEMMGPTRDRVMDRAQERARSAGEKAKDVARETASRTAKNAVDNAFSGGEEDRQDSVSEPKR